MVDNCKIDILVVDDLPEKLLVYESILAELEQNLVSARSGTEALKLVLRQEFAVILLDVNMPGMDGFETARMIRQRKKSAHTPIIFITAFADEVRAAEGYAHGAVDYIPTPIVPEILRAKVKVFVELFRMRQQVAQQAEEQAKRAAAEEAALHAAFLADASRTLAGSLDLDVTLRRLAQLCVPRLADSSVVYLANEQGLPPRTEWAWFDGEGDTAASGEQPPDVPPEPPVPPVPPPWLMETINRVLGTGRIERTGSGLVLPLLARGGKTLGALGLVLAGRRHQQRDTTLAIDLADRAAAHLENALLVRDIQENDRHRNEFLAMLAHELRNPLAPIRNAIYLFRLFELREPALIEARDIVDRQLTHLIRLVDDLLDVSRITRGKIQLQRRPIDVASLVGTALETSRPLIEQRRQELTLTLPDGPVLVEVDPARMAQVLSNLLNNAAKYTDEGGRIWLSVENGNTEVTFRVRDSGMGIAPEMLPRVFDLFAQADRSLARAQGGLGVGLTLVRRLVEMHGGQVRAHSPGLGCGSEFVVSLPVLPDSTFLSDPAAISSPGLSPKPGLRTLVIDDNVDAASSLSMLLRMAGHVVEQVHDGATALEMVEGFAPAIVLLDIGLPGMSGFEVARHLRGRAATRDVRLVAITGYGQEEDRRLSREAGFDAHMTKPIHPGELNEVMARLTNGRGPGGEGGR